ncbi:hypothetical protein HELRODRAFT_191323 [Helobdella robusta]|uniref:Fucolectin tachylectin-4 pentraxin-1 domain-containing protein n=1 Tax=Helobdella robusta TaxID=6412 RepID=T1FSV9_HELRO|nr:hypothetical protein HELRODRAFT_191323 [Helobdella robusta]ESO05529.1 hypothetical protein HELRODRAFT_191323 [Helobdella robusta]
MILKLLSLNGMIFLILTVLTEKCNAQNLALRKETICSSVFDNLSLPSNLVDGDSNPNYSSGHCYHGSDGPGGPNWAVVDLVDSYYVDYVNLFSRDYCCPERMDYFVIGLDSKNYNGLDVVRGTYPLCGQYKYKAVGGGKHTLKCNAHLTSAHRYVIAQQPVYGPGAFSICELEVFAANYLNSKIWKRFFNRRLSGYVSGRLVVNGRIKCLLTCIPGSCDSVNFQVDGSVCELNRHLNGYLLSSLNLSSGWSFYEVQYA